MIRRCNPCNIRLSADKWRGGIYPPPPSARGFVVFRDNAHGYRATYKILQAYQSRYKLSTIRTLIARYCPAGDADNNPELYATHVAEWSGVGIDTKISTKDKEIMLRIVGAMSRQESGEVDNKALEEGWRII